MSEAGAEGQGREGRRLHLQKSHSVGREPSFKAKTKNSWERFPSCLRDLANAGPSAQNTLSFPLDSVFSLLPSGLKSPSSGKPSLTSPIRSNPLNVDLPSVSHFLIANGFYNAITLSHNFTFASLWLTSGSAPGLQVGGGLGPSLGVGEALHPLRWNQRQLRSALDGGCCPTCEAGGDFMRHTETVFEIVDLIFTL